MGSVTITSGGGGAAGGASFEHAEAVTSTTPQRKRIELRIITWTSLTQGRVVALFAPDVEPSFYCT
jgi:hypothetical protein